MPCLDNFGRRKCVTGICHYVNDAGDEGKDSCGQKNGLHNISISSNKQLRIQNGLTATSTISSGKATEGKLP
jgi:hypothetical protein